jgi:hypothetical protein
MGHFLIAIYWVAKPGGEVKSSSSACIRVFLA